MKLHPLDQRTEEWFDVRLGKLTGSRAADAMATLKSTKEAASRKNLRVQLAVERLTHQSAEREYDNADMQRGRELEPEALAAAELLLGCAIHPMGFVEHDDLAAGCSPDGVVGDFEGIIEIKCPRSSTHFEWWKGGVLPSEHLLQVVHSLWVTGAQWCEFISYDPRFPAHLQVFHVRHQRDDAEIQAYELLARQFLREVDQDVETMNGLVAA